MAAVMMIVEAELLLAVRGVLGVIHIQHDDRRWRGITGDELIDERPSDAIEVFSGGRILQARERRGTGQIARAVQRPALQAEFEQWITPQGVGVIAILIGAGDLIHALGNQVAQRVRDVAGGDAGR